MTLQGGAPTHAIVWLVISNAVEILTAAWCLRIAFDGVPRLNSVKAFAKYSFYAVFLAPFVGAFFGALSYSSNYWATWKVAFFSEALGFLTLMPAILGWAREIPLWAKKAARSLRRSNCATPCADCSWATCFRLSSGEHPSHTALFPGAAPDLVHFAFRFDGSQHVDDCHCVCIDLGRNPWPRSVHRTGASYRHLVAPTVPISLLPRLSWLSRLSLRRPTMWSRPCGKETPS